jgi:YHS domain-containing protein
MITTLIAFALLGVSHPQKLSLTCPVTGEDITTPFASYNYKGARFDMCCGMCPGPFSKNPDKYLDPAKVKGTVGVSYFDPVSGIAVKPNALRAKADSVGPSVFQGVAYYFENKDDQKSFDADPKKYTVVPAKEAIYCPVMKQEVSDLAHSGGYTDVNGVRYYICCSQCAAMLAKDPDKYLDADAAKHVHDVVAVKFTPTK